MHSHVYNNPESYSKNNSLQYNFAMQILQYAKIDAGDRVLDLGCGDGRITSHIAKVAHNGLVVGTDISPKMVEHANATYVAQENLRFMEMDASRNIFINQFDVITSFNSLHWVKDQENALNGIAKAATSGAKVILLLSHRKSAYHLTIDQLSASTKWQPYFKNYVSPRSFFTREQYQTLLLNAGLEISSLREIEMTHEYGSIDELKAFLAASMANIKQIPDILKDDYLDDFCVEFLKQPSCSNNNRISLSFWCLEVFACKKSPEIKNQANESISPSAPSFKL